MNKYIVTTSVNCFAYKCQTRFVSGPKQIDIFRNQSCKSVFHGRLQNTNSSSIDKFLAHCGYKSICSSIQSVSMSSCEGISSSHKVERKSDILDNPIVLEGEVVKGFGRGSKEIGCPTANFSQDIVENKLPATLDAGIYLGWAKLDGESDRVEKAVVSIGWNPFYKNTKKSVETHILKTYDTDFYGRWMKLKICGYIRPELNFDGLDALIMAIKEDVEHAKQQLDQSIFLKMKEEECF